MRQPVAQVLVISPDGVLLKAARQAIESLGHCCFMARDVHEAQRTVVRTRVDLVCLDSVLDGDEVNRFWRWICSNQKASLPTLLIAPAAANDVKSTAFFLSRGQRQSVLTKPVDSLPFSREVARLLAEPADFHREADLSRVGSLVLDGAAHRLYIESTWIALTPTEFRLLRCLMQRPEEFVAPEDLLREVWQYAPGTGAPELVRSHVRNLRRKLRAAGSDPGTLRTASFRGYGLFPGRARTETG